MDYDTIAILFGIGALIFFILATTEHKREKHYPVVDGKELSGKTLNSLRLVSELGLLEKIHHNAILFSSVETMKWVNAENKRIRNSVLFDGKWKIEETDKEIIYTMQKGDLSKHDVKIDLGRVLESWENEAVIKGDSTVQDSVRKEKSADDKWRDGEMKFGDYIFWNGVEESNKKTKFTKYKKGFKYIDIRGMLNELIEFVDVGMGSYRWKTKITYLGVDTYAFTEDAWIDKGVPNSNTKNK